MQQETCKVEARTPIDNLTSVLQNESMIRPSHIEEALKQQASADMNRLNAIEAEQRKIREAYMRYRDLDDEKKQKDTRLRRTAAMLGHDFDELVEGNKKYSDYALAVTDLTLWEAMQTILEQVPEIQLYELQHALEAFNKRVSRQAIESAVVTHKDKFESKSRGREKFVSLKR